MTDTKDLPAWQRNATDGSTQAAVQEHDASSSAIDRVRKFLADPAVRNAPADKKKAFLLSKNVPDEMIHQVMGSDALTTAPDTDGTKHAAQQEFDASKRLPVTDGSDDAANQEFDAGRKTPQGPRHVKPTDGSSEAAQQEFDASKRLSGTPATHAPTEAAKQEYDASHKAPQGPSYVKTADGSQEAAKQEFDASKSTPINPADFKATPSASAPLLRRDIPPIVTYPEFLVQPQKPPPLVTVGRLVNTAYFAGALTASVYALSKYIIAPMSDNLNQARHDLLDHSNDHIRSFNDKLANLVSIVPSSAKSSPATPDLDDSDAESFTSDPTELFHRDVGTQTSPSLSRRPSISSSETGAEKPEAVATKHAARLRIIESHLAELLSANENNGTTNQTLQNGVGEARHYLDTLYYAPPAYQYAAGETAYNPPGTSKDKNDAAASLKAEIRGVKGILLSAKRFPSAGKAGT